MLRHLFNKSNNLFSQTYVLGWARAEILIASCEGKPQLRSIMKYSEMMPPESLRHIVRYFWVIENDDQDQQLVQYKLFAESCPGLVFFCRSGYGVISGPTVEHKAFSISGSFKMIGAYLYPYTLPLLFQCSAGEFTGKQIRLSELHEEQARRLADQILNAKDNQQRVNYISDYLYLKVRNSANGNQPLHSGIQKMMHANGNLSIDSMANDVNLSQRQIERKFLSEVGISPKLFSRLIRFQYSLRIPLKQRINSLTDLALQAGYYDQSHFIRDFIEFSGISPKEYFNRQQTQIADNFIQI